MRVERHAVAAQPAGIYTIEDRSGRMYVGSSNAMKNRWACHRLQLERGIHHNYKLQAAWKELGGVDEFTFKVLQYVSDLENLHVYEQYWIDTLGPYYNVATEAGKPTVSEPAKARRALARIDRELHREAAWRKRVSDARGALATLRALLRACEGLAWWESDFPGGGSIESIARKFEGLFVRAWRNVDPWDVTDEREYVEDGYGLVYLGEQTWIQTLTHACEAFLRRNADVLAIEERVEAALRIAFGARWLPRFRYNPKPAQPQSAEHRRVLAAMERNLERARLGL